MLCVNHIAFKEWAVVCAALGEGRQSLILRKGGIHEGAGGFQPDHHEFWLFPTYEHEQAEELIDEARPLLERAERARPDAGIVQIEHYAVVEDVMQIRDAIVLPSLAGLHIWSARTVEKRFHYRRPGLFLLVARVYRVGTPFEMPNSPHFAGCRSWVELPIGLATEALEPVLSDDEFRRRHTAIKVAASPIRLA
jgi:hypothetical protein